MPTLEINEAQIYYEAYGKDQPGKAPIVLIHGSTVTGQRDWGLVAPLLGREHRVLVPDCRGHGQSSNPKHSYSFKEMADDTQALIRALGYSRAHLIGHSNGGNVALVTLLEYPEVVQSAVIQAANAYVSPDLVEEEPLKFDPERVASEAPAWRDEMIELHGAYQGVDYWRELLRLTVREIIAEPNYTPEDLQKVNRAVLVIQGEVDRVNAAAGHAQFIAEHIPYAELWLPQGVGHNVHDERLFEWVQKVLAFLRRRGEAANEALYRLGHKRFRDERETVYEVRAEASRPGDAAGVCLSGQVLTDEQREEAVRCLEQAGLGPVAAGELKVLLNESTPWALVRRGVADLRREPRSLSERVSQVLYGERLRILQACEEYSWVRMSDDGGVGSNGYMGWVHSGALWSCTAEDAQAYQRALNGLVSAERAVVYGAEMDLSKLEGGDLRHSIGRLSFGVPVCIAEDHRSWLALRSPEGERLWAQSGDILPLSQRPKPDAQGIASTLDLIRRFTGIPYLWGGRSSFGYDCSGLAQAFYAFMGVAIPRDADQQCRDALPVEGQPEPGDLLFFGNPGKGSENERYGQVTHVAISFGGTEYIHAKGGAMGITTNSFDLLSPVYNAYLKEHLLAVGRFR
jgi:pimeloyl-ACP methyl ester carboxylesterase/cell wall-associated NlpC family hydrolase